MRISLSQNKGILDRGAHICIGIVLVVLGAFIVAGAIGIILMILSIPLFLSSIVSFCPAYGEIAPYDLPSLLLGLWLPGSMNNEDSGYQIRDKTANKDHFFHDAPRSKV
jgi:hypothetical protein